MKMVHFGLGLWGVRFSVCSGFGFGYGTGADSGTGTDSGAALAPKAST